MSRKTMKKRIQAAKGLYNNKYNFNNTLNTPSHFYNLNYFIQLKLLIYLFSYVTKILK